MKMNKSSLLAYALVVVSLGGAAQLIAHGGHGPGVHCEECPYRDQCPYAQKRFNNNAQKGAPLQKKALVKPVNKNI
jgi:hypothetical protein